MPRLCTDCDHDVERASDCSVVKLCAACSAELSKGRTRGYLVHNEPVLKPENILPHESGKAVWEDVSFLIDTPNGPRKVRYTEP